MRFEPEKNIEPATVKLVVPARVMAPSRLCIVKFRQFGVELVVTVNEPVPTFELASKYTSSEVVGAEAPLAPPELVDQLVVDELVQLPVPPTQYLSAI